MSDGAEKQAAAGSGEADRRGDDPSAKAGQTDAGMPEQPRRPPPQREFPVVQYGFTVPKPSYHGQLGADSIDPDELAAAAAADDGTDAEAAGTDRPDAAGASAQSAHRARKIRLWAFFVLVLLIYGLMRTVQYMR